MVKKKVLRVIAIIFLIIGLIHGLISYSLTIFFTWLLIGLWIVFTIRIFENIKHHREYNSPHNTAFFVVLPLFFGIFYSIWGSFTGLLGESLIGGAYFSYWSLIFAFPFVMYGLYSLYLCFKKYNIIYFGRKSVKARALGYILSISVLIFIIAYWITLYSFIEFPLVDLNLLLLFIAIVLILIVFGFTSTSPSIPTLTRNYIAERTRRINNLTTRPTQTQRTRTTRTTNAPPSTRTTTRTTRSRTQSSRTTPTSHRQTARTRTTNTTHTTHVKPTLKVRDLNKYKPRASYLTVDDFKCIFCFSLPKLPGDRGRGIVVCPNCRYPAHADEFKDWMRTSNLCSRCSAPIPSGFRRNPRIISVKNYLIVYRYFLKKKR
ncbi:hypothetical protein ES704_02138 [subsurface metagenome]|jgi:hypothetical protein